MYGMLGGVEVCKLNDVALLKTLDMMIIFHLCTIDRKHCLRTPHTTILATAPSLQYE